MESNLTTIKAFLQGSSGGYLPDFATILNWLDLDKAALEETNITIPTRLFRFLITAQLVAQSFDETSYLAANPDVAEAVRAGNIESGWAHFVTHGYFEGRSPGEYEIDEIWYRRKYPDVALAERRGQIRAKEHYARTGRREDRATSVIDEKLKSIWKAAISR